MSALIADLYALLWKHFERQSSKDEDFLASGTCGLCVFIGFANLAQVLAFVLGRNPGAFSVSSKSGQWLAGAVTLALCVIGMKMFIARHPDLQSQELITGRYSRMSSKRKVSLTIAIFANPAILFILRKLILSES